MSTKFPQICCYCCVGLLQDVLDPREAAIPSTALAQWQHEPWFPATCIGTSESTEKWWISGSRILPLALYSLIRSYIRERGKFLAFITSTQII